MAWTDQMVEDLKVMWKQGLTTAEIGKRLGVSKNSIVGKVHRLGLSGRPSPIKKKEVPTEKATSTVSKEKTTKTVNVSKTPEVTVAKVEPKTEVVIEEKKAVTKDKEIEKPVALECQKSNFERNGKAVSLTELDNHTCRWPIGDPKDENFHFCGKKVRIGQTYCDEHSLVAYVKPIKTK